MTTVHRNRSVLAELQSLFQGSSDVMKTAIKKTYIIFPWLKIVSGLLMDAISPFFFSFFFFEERKYENEGIGEKKEESKEMGEID